MVTVKSKYLGGLRTESTHLRSGKTIITDAPVDNNGRGEAFSPSDLVATALGNCMITIMGMLAERENIDLKSVSYETTKIMTAEPRRISEIQINFDMREVKVTDVQKQKLKNAAMTCPVALSISPEIKQTVDFLY